MEIDPRLRSRLCGDSSTDRPRTNAADDTRAQYPNLSPRTSNTSPSDQFPVSTPSSGPSAPPYYSPSAPSHTLTAAPAADPPPSYPANASLVTPTSSLQSASADPQDPLADLKRPRACDPCRQLKVRCEADASGPCRRCVKAGRRCVVSAPARKRQKKTDSRVAELERKIDALTATLHARQGVATVVKSEPDQKAQGWGGGLPPPPTLPQSSSDDGRTGTPMWERRHNDSHAADVQSLRPGPSPSSRAGSQPGRDKPFAEPWPPVFATLDPVLRLESDHEVPDVIDQGLVDLGMAAKLFDHYVNDLAPHMPVVIFPPGTKMEEVRRSRPVLFLAVLAITIGPFQPSLQLVLTTEVHRTFADRAIVRAEKSLELVQAMLLTSLWYVPPDNMEEMKFFQLTHIAVVMAMDIGMGRRMKVKRKQLGLLLREGVNKRILPLATDAPETRRAWLGCYILGVNTCMTLRRPLLVRWSPYMDECVEILKMSPDSCASDGLLIAWANLCHICEEISIQFSMDDPLTNVSLGEAKVQYALKGFEKQLDQWRKEVSLEHYNQALQLAEHSVDIYMHEIALHIDHNIDDFRPPYFGGLQESRANPATAAHIDALTSCLTSVRSLLGIIMHLESKTILCLPTISYARTAYAVVALIRLYCAVSAPNSRLGEVFEPADLNVEAHLDRLIDCFRLANGSRTVVKFGCILEWIRNRFLKSKEQTPGTKETSDPARSESEHRTQSGEGCDRKPANSSTSLHLLSEIAIGEPSNPSGSQSCRPTSVNSGVGGTTTTVDPDSWSQYPPPPVVSTTSSSAPPLYSAPFQQAKSQEQPFGLDGSGAPVAQSLVQPGLPVYPDYLPDLSMQIYFDSDGLFAVGNMLDDGLFNLPLDGNQQFYW